MNNYFEIFSLPAQFEINLEDLEAAYLKLSNKYHPDKFQDEQSKTAAYQNTITINRAYSTLKTPLLRAEYLLLLKGLNVSSEENTIKPSHDLLMNILKLREKLEEISDINILDNFISQQGKNLNKLYITFNQKYRDANFEGAAQIAIEIKYISKLIEESKKKLKNVT